MKKLFLYIVFFAYLFWCAYMIAWDVFDKDMRENTSYDTDKNEQMIQAKTYDVFVDDGSLPFGEQEKTKYIISINNGYLVIYENNKDNIFEYTDIDAKLIKVVNPSLYSELCNDIIFYDLADVYSFLETVSS